MNAGDFGVTEDARLAAEEDARPYRGLAPAERYRRFLDLMRFMESILRSLDPGKRSRYDRVQTRLDDPGRWWERVPAG